MSFHPYFGQFNVVRFNYNKLITEYLFSPCKVSYRILSFFSFCLAINQHFQQWSTIAVFFSSWHNQLFPLVVWDPSFTPHKYSSQVSSDSRCLSIKHLSAIGSHLPYFYLSDRTSKLSHASASISHVRSLNLSLALSLFLFTHTHTRFLLPIALASPPRSKVGLYHPRPSDHTSWKPQRKREC